jgi:hypothetical protein
MFSQQHSAIRPKAVGQPNSSGIASVGLINHRTPPHVPVAAQFRLGGDWRSGAIPRLAARNQNASLYRAIVPELP